MTDSSGDVDEVSPRALSKQSECVVVHSPQAILYPLAQQNFGIAVVTSAGTGPPLVISLGAAPSQFLTGLITDATSYNMGFAFLATVATVGLCVFFTTVPETKP